MPDAKKNVAYTIDVSLISQASRPSIKTTPTLAAGDVKVTGANGSAVLAALANITTLPDETPAASGLVRVQLSAAEMNFDRVAIRFVDAAGAEWDDLVVEILTTTVTVDDVVRSTTPANTLDVLGGRATANADQIDGSAPAAVNLKQSSLAVLVGTVQAAEGAANTATVFDTNLPLEATGYYGNASGGIVVAFISSANDKYQTRRIVNSVTGTLNTRVTVEEAFDAIPTNGDVFVVLGRITELS